MPTAEGKPVVLVITNIPAWTHFREVIGHQVKIVSARHDPFAGWNEARDIGGPDVVAIGCLKSLALDRPFDPTESFMRMIMKPLPDGPGFSGPIIGLCECCVADHLDAGCIEVVQFGADAAKRILEILHLEPVT